MYGKVSKTRCFFRCFGHPKSTKRDQKGMFFSDLLSKGVSEGIQGRLGDEFWRSRAVFFSSQGGILRLPEDSLGPFWKASEAFSTILESCWEANGRILFPALSCRFLLFPAVSCCLLRFPAVAHCFLLFPAVSWFFLWFPGLLELLGLLDLLRLLGLLAGSLSLSLSHFLYDSSRSFFTFLEFPWIFEGIVQKTS